MTEMTEGYVASLLVTAGACLGVGLYALDLSLHGRGRSYALVLALSVIEAAYCLGTYRHLHEGGLDHPLRWGVALWVLLPSITYLFGELTFSLSEVKTRRLALVQKVNRGLVAAAVFGVAADAIFDVRLTARAFHAADPDGRLLATSGGVFLAVWTGAALVASVAALFADSRHRRPLLPIALGWGGYVSAMLYDAGALVRDGHGTAVQQVGFWLLLGTFWRRLRSTTDVARREQQADSVRLEAERERLEEERRKVLLAAPLLHKQKLDSVGTLAAGVAHEINNPVHSILNYAQLLKRGLATEAREREFAVEIEREANSIAEVVRHLLFFGRADDAEMVAVEVRAVVSDTFVLLRAPLRDDGIRLEMSVAEDARDIVCRIQQLQLVLLNLVTNSRDALGRRNPARTDDKIISLRVLPTPDKPDWIRFEVIDSGDGFDEATAGRVFDPFFTTKPFGEGTGLGLSICHGIVVSHGGTMSCQSELARQTRFIVDLPCTPPSKRTSGLHAQLSLSLPPPALEPLHPSGTRRVRNETSLTISHRGDGSDDATAKGEADAD